MNFFIFFHQFDYVVTRDVCMNGHTTQRVFDGKIITNPKASGNWYVIHLY